MRELDLDQLAADPVLEARARSDSDSMTVTGYVRSVEGSVISLARSRSDDVHVEYPRSSVLAAFESEDDDDRVTLLVKKDARVRVVKTLRADRANEVADCACGDPDVQYMIPLSALHPMLAEMAKLRREVADKIASGWPAELGRCGAAYAYCLVSGHTPEYCRERFFECTTPQPSGP